MGKADQKKTTQRADSRKYIKFFYFLSSPIILKAWKYFVLFKNSTLKILLFFNKSMIQNSLIISNGTFKS